MDKWLIISLALVYLTSFIDAFGMSMIIPILPKYTDHFGSSTTEYGICFASYAIAQFFSLIIMGKLSDKCGRKILLLASLFGSCTGPFLQALCNSTWTFTAARFYTGCLGGSMTISYAYISDCIESKNRPKYQSQVCGVVCVAYVGGPLVGSSLVNVHLRFPLWLAGGFAGVVLLLSIFFMKDTKYFIAARKEAEEKSKLEESNLELSQDKEKEKEKGKEKDEDKILPVVDPEQLDISTSASQSKTKLSIKQSLNSSKLDSNISNSNLVVKDEENNKNRNEEENEEDDTEARISRISIHNMGTAIVYDHVSREHRNSKIETEKQQQQLQQQKNIEGNKEENGEIIEADKVNKVVEKQRDYLVDNFWIIYILLIIECFVVIGNMTVFDVIFPLMAIDSYDLSSIYSGIIYAVSSLEYAAFQVYLFQKMRKCFDLVTIYFIALPVSLMGDLIISFSKVLWLFVIGVFFQCLGGAMVASHHTIITSLISSPEAGGKYLGYLMSVDGLARIVIPLMMTPIYSKYRGLPFQIGACICAVGVCVAFIIRYQTRDVRIVKKIRK